MRFRALDSWRGIAALGVVFFHMPIAWSFYDSGLVRHAWLAVDFFFVLSGFVMAFTYGQRIFTGRQFTDFMIKRFGRVWPLHAAVVFGLILLQTIVLLLTRYAHFPMPNNRPFDGPWNTGAILPNFLLIHSLGFMAGPGTWNTPSWSISVEFYTYIMFGFVVLTMARRVLLASSLLAGVGLCLLVWFSPAYLGSTTSWGFARCVYGFFLGVILFHLEARLPKPSRFVASAAEIAISIAAFVFIWKVGPSPLTLVAPFLFAVLVLVFAKEAGLISVALKARPCAWLGEHSYTIYMIHLSAFVVLNYAFRAVEHFAHRKLTVTYALPKGFDNPDQITDHIALTLGSSLKNNVLAAGMLTIIFAAAAIVYRHIEMPARDLIKRVADKHDKIRSSAAVAQIVDNEVMADQRSSR